MAPVPTATANGITICYETFGNPEDPALLLIMGLGAQMIEWPDEFCQHMADRGFHVIRFDNRDVGESTWIDTPGFDAGEIIMGLLMGADATPPYLLSDMAADAAGLLDALGVDAAHVVGASMGGMITQALAIEHPERVRSICSIMSTTGDPDVGQPDPELATVLLAPRPTEGEEAIQAGIAIVEAISCKEHYDAERTREKVIASTKRGINPDGVARQLVAILASGSRSEGLAALTVPALVIHGRQDRLVTFSGGERTAEVIPNATFLPIDDMAHDVPEVHWERIIEAIVTNIGRAA